MKWKIIIIGIILIVTECSLGCINEKSSNKNNYEFLSALEMVENASSHLNSLEIDGDFRLFEVRLYHNGKNGKYTGGRVQFVDLLNPYNDTTTIAIWFKNGEIDDFSIYYNNSIGGDILIDFPYNISDIKIDSDIAYDIAIKISKIEQFLLEGKKYGIKENGIELFSNGKYIYYSLSWAYQKEKNEPDITTNIYLDAKNGNELTIEDLIKDFL